MKQEARHKVIIKDNTNIFKIVVIYYSIEKEGEKSKSSNREKEAIVPIAKALMCLKVLRSWKL